VALYNGDSTPLHKHRMKRFYRRPGAIQRRIRVYRHFDDEEDPDAIDFLYIGGVTDRTNAATGKADEGKSEG